MSNMFFKPFKCTPSVKGLPPERGCVLNSGQASGGQVVYDSYRGGTSTNV